MKQGDRTSDYGGLLTNYVYDRRSGGYKYDSSRKKHERPAPFRRVEVKIREGKTDTDKDEILRAALFKFRKLCERSGIFNDIRNKEFFEQPSSKRRRKRRAAIARSNRERAESEGATQGSRGTKEEE